MQTIYIGVAWPYANGPLHLGHVAGSLLPPDVFRRYHRMAGNRVLMVSGSDCHGTPILLKAEAEGTTPEHVVERFHADHVAALERLGIGFDLFTRTTTENHRDVVQRLFLDALEAGYIEKRTQSAPFDTVAGRFLPDRYVEGTCPHCGATGARGDQCDQCGKTLDPQDLKDPHSKLNPGSPIEFRDTEHFFFLLSRLQPALERYVGQTAAHWRPNTLNFTQNWLRDGLQDRAITRDLTWGVPIPLEGYDDKRIYVWFEAVCGYLSAAIEWARRSAAGAWDGVLDGAHVQSAPGALDAEAWRQWWTDADSKAYYFLGKDNIPFHTIIWPAILTAANEARAARGEPPLVLPWDVPANEFLNLSGQQFSKSRGVGIGVHEVLDRFQPDSVRYYLAANMPETRDADWTWDDFLAKVNDELVGTLGNLVHRVLSFVQKNLGEIPARGPGTFDSAVQEAIDACVDETGLHVSNVNLRQGIRRVMLLAQQGNQWMQEQAPWKLLKEDPAEARTVLHALLRIVKALAVTMAPYLPDAAEKTWRMLQEEGSVHDAGRWRDAAAPLREGAKLAPPEALFRKLEAKDIPGGQAKQPPKGTEGGTKGGTNGARAGKKGSGIESAGAGKASGGAHLASTGNGPQDAPDGNGLVAFSDFQRLEIRIARVLSVDEHPKADKLYVLRLDVGGLGERQVVAGLKAYYEPRDLEGRPVAFVANLEPAMLRGVESQGMILAADHDGTVSVLGPHRDVPAGAKVR